MNNTLVLVILAICAGSMIPFQSSMNTQLGKSLQSPYFSALTVFAVAFVGLSIYVLASSASIPTTAQFNAAPKWSYFGGILGGAYILLIILLAPKLGIGNVTVLVLMGQVLAAMVIDQFGLLGTVAHPINWLRGIGVLLLCTGVYLIKKY